MRQHNSAMQLLHTHCSQNAAVLIGHTSLKLPPQILLLFDVCYIGTDCRAPDTSSRGNVNGTKRLR